MKRYASRVLKTIAALYLAFPMSYLVIAAILFNISAENCVRLLLTPSYWILSALGIVAGVGLWEMRRWSWYALIGANSFMVYESAWIVTEYGASFHGAVAFLLGVALAAGVVLQVSREIRVPYLFPRIRWWESNPRYKLSAPVVVRRTDGAVVEGEILDISAGGCFVKMQQDLGQHEAVSLNFALFDLPVACKGAVVWRTYSTVTHPKGVGVKFEPLQKHERRSLRLISRRLKQISQLYRKSRYLLSAEEFQKQIERLDTPQPTSSRFALRRKKK